MQFIYFIIIALFSTILNATSYQSIHQRFDAYKNKGFINQIDKMIELSKTSFPGQYSTSTYEFYLSENINATQKLEDGSMCTNENFHHFKIYIPVGTEYFALSFGGIGNPGYVINYSYKPVKIDHANMIPDWIGNNKEKIFKGGGQFTGYVASRDGTKSIVSPKNSPFMDSGGWLYIDVIRGNSFSPSNRESGNQMKKYLVKFTLDIKVKETDKLKEWLKKAKEDYNSKTFKIIKPNGDPYDATSSINIITKSCTKGIVNEQMIVSKGLYEQPPVNAGYSSSAITYQPVVVQHSSSVQTTHTTTTATSNSAKQQCIKSGGTWIAEVKLCDKSSIQHTTQSSSTPISYLPNPKQKECEQKGGVWLDEQAICDTSIKQQSSSSSVIVTIPTSNDNAKRRSQCINNGGTWIAEVNLCNMPTISHSSSSSYHSQTSSLAGNLSYTTLNQKQDCENGGGTWLAEAKLCLSKSSSSSFAQNINHNYSSSQQSSSVSVNSDNINTVISKLVRKAHKISGLFINYSPTNEVNKWVFVAPDLNIVAKISDKQQNESSINWDIIQTTQMKTFSKIEIDDDLRSVSFGEIINNSENFDTVAYDLVNQKKYVNGYFIHYGDGLFDWAYVNNAFDFIAKFDGIDKVNNKIKWTMIQNPLTGLISFDSVRFTADKKHIRFEPLK